MKDLHKIAADSRTSFYDLSSSSIDARNAFLFALADILQKELPAVSYENEKDLRLAEKNGLPAPLLHRLRFDQEKCKRMISALTSLAGLPDPVGQTTYAREIADGLRLYRVVCPIGVIGVIFESRPDAMIQIASLCIKSGNTAILKGGSEALNTNTILCDLIQRALMYAHLPPLAVQMIENREDVSAMLKEDKLIDLIIPRGSNQFVRYIMDNSHIPVLGHADGVCHVYIDSDADPEIAVKVALDSKIQNVSVCNAAETILIHKNASPEILARLSQELVRNHVQIVGDSFVQEIIHCDPASENDWKTEYLDYKVSIRSVSDIRKAIDHINRYGSHHTDCIVTCNPRTASLFLTLVDSSGVYWNASTRFSDGYVYGLGAEVGIATGKLHARGPMGLEGLTTYKYKLIGAGHTMSEMISHEIPYTHKVLEESCPL